MSTLPARVRLRCVVSLFPVVLTSTVPPAHAQACTPDDAVARVVVVEGLLRTGGGGAIPVGTRLCVNDTVRTDRASRAVIELRAEKTLIRLRENTVLRLRPPVRRRSVLRLIEGVIHLFSQTPRTLDVETEFVTAGIEGTEFLVARREQTFIGVYQGHVLVYAPNDPGRTPLYTLAAGMSLTADSAGIGRPGLLASPEDAVEWAVYYPPVISGGALAGISADLRAGRIEAARAALDALPSSSADSLALEAIIAVAKNRGDEALRLAEAALVANPTATAALIAQSYAEQARFRLELARTLMSNAVTADPENPIANARLAELWLATGYSTEARASAQRAVALDDSNSRAHAMLGFSALSEVDLQAARGAFATAMRNDPGDPLPRLGAGLAEIRAGNLAEGRRQLEIAVSLDPLWSLARSYLGKAYYADGAPDNAAEQYRLATTLDPNDPTPHFYDAFRLQASNRSLPALEQLELARSKNDNRAVYRSRLMLDEDAAARSAARSQTSRSLGFDALTGIEGARSVLSAPGSFSAHRLLADAYFDRPGFELARNSELLQAQLRSPVSSSPVPARLFEPRLAASRVFGPTTISQGEFSRLYDASGVSAEVNLVGASQDTQAGELLLNLLGERAAVSLGGFRYHSDGFRENNDQDVDIYNLFSQYEFGSGTRGLVEVKQTTVDGGDPFLLFDRELFSPNLRLREDRRQLRAGFYHRVAPGNEILVHASAIESDDDIDFIAIAETDQRVRSISLEAQHGSMPGSHYLVYGAASHRINTRTRTSDFDIVPGEVTVFSDEVDSNSDALYAYAISQAGESFTVNYGLSAADVDDPFNGFDDTQVSPKLGVMWESGAGTVRAAAFRTLRTTLVDDRSLEPTHVAGFNQLYDDLVGTDASVAGLAYDHRVHGAGVYTGVELVHRDLDVPAINPFLPDPFFTGQWRERRLRAYAYWPVAASVALSLELSREDAERDPDFVGEESFTSLVTDRADLGVVVFAPQRTRIAFEISHVDQRGDFADFFGNVVSDGDSFVVTGVVVEHLFAGRAGSVTLSVDNLGDETFDYQASDPENTRLVPERRTEVRLGLLF